LHLDDPETAIRHLQRAVLLCRQPLNAPELSLAEAYVQQGLLEEAERRFRHVLEWDPLNPRAHLGLGRLFQQQGNLQESLGHLQRSAASPLAQKASAVLLTQVYHQLGDAAAAAREQARASELPVDPPWPDLFVEETRALMVGKQARLARLQTLHRQGRADEARALGRQLEEEYPDVYWLVEGREQMARANLAAALQAFRKAVELSPASVDALFDLGTVQACLEDYRGAAEHFRKVAELEPGYGPAYQKLGECREQLGDRAGAIEALLAAIQYQPQNGAAHRALGRLFAAEGRNREAREHLERAMQIQP
jgi:tetratricopeptide (TPR) repeat protein